MIRQLSNDERGIMKRQISRLTDELEYFNYLIRYNELMLESGLELSYDEEIKENREALKQIIKKPKTRENLFKKKYYELMIDKGVRVNYKRKVAQTQKDLRTFKENIEEYKNRIKIMKDQIRNGVEVKEESKPLGVN